MPKTAVLQSTNKNSSAISNEEIALLAYFYWQKRGCPEGSPEVDWLRAEQDLHPMARAASA